jgi:pyruvate formate lyase activating enzyme
MDETTCPTRAFRLYGRPMGIDEIVAKALDDKGFYNASGGGVTLSGGEPLLFPEWSLALLAAFKKAGLHTCLDTSLFAPREVIDAMLGVTDMWLPDFKAADDALHIRCTGVSNARIKANLARLAEAGATLEVRCLSVPGLTDGEDLEARHGFLHSLGIRDDSIVDLPYNDLARAKRIALRGLP